MARNLTDADLLVIDERVGDLLGYMHDATDKINKLRADKLADPLKLAKTLAICARDAANLSAMLMWQAHMQDQKAEIERLKAGAS